MMSNSDNDWKFIWHNIILPFKQEIIFALGILISALLKLEVSIKLFIIISFCILLIIFLIVKMKRASLLPFNIGIADLVPFIIEERRIKKTYSFNGKVDYEICQKMRIVRTIDTFIKFTMDYPEFDEKSEVKIVREREKNSISLVENVDYFLYENSSKKDEYKLEINIVDLAKDDIFTINIKRSVTNDSEKILYRNSTTAIFGIKKLILEWSFPNEANIHVSMQVVNKFVYRRELNNNKIKCPDLITKENKRINKRKNRIKDGDTKGVIEIVNPIPGITYRVIGTEIQEDLCSD